MVDAGSSRGPNTAREVMASHWDEDEETGSSGEHDDLNEIKFSELGLGKACLQRELVPMEADAYHYLLLMVMQWRDGRARGSIANVIVSILLYAAAVIIELSMCFFLLLSTEDIENSWEDENFLQNYNTTVYGAADLLFSAAGSSAVPGVGISEQLLEKCATQLDVPFLAFYYITLFFWVLLMVQELRAAVWLLISILGVERRVRDEPLIKTDEEEKVSIIVRMEAWMKALLLVLVPGIKMAIALMVTYVGAKFLLLQTDDVKLLLKVVAMTFVLSMDEMILKSIATPGVLKHLSVSKLDTHYGAPRVETPYERGWGSLFHFVMALVMLATICWMFDDLMTFRKGCHAYHHEHTIPGVPPCRTYFAAAQSIFS